MSQNHQFKTLNSLLVERPDKCRYMTFTVSWWQKISAQMRESARFVLCKPFSVAAVTQQTTGLMQLRHAFAYSSSPWLPSVWVLQGRARLFLLALFKANKPPVLLLNAFEKSSKHKEPQTKSNQTVPELLPPGLALGQRPCAALQMHPGCISASGSCFTGRAGKEHCWPSRSSMLRASQVWQRAC